MRFVTAYQLMDLIKSNIEIALLDVRERGPFSKKHLLLSSCVPLSQLETMVYDLVPRRSTKTIIIGEGPANLYSSDRRAAERLDELKYTDVSILQGGIEGWQGAGFELFSGVHVLGKAFGEIVAEVYKTPSVSAHKEQERIDTREEHVILDSRPRDEYTRMTVPGSVNAPGAELVYRVHDAVPDTRTPVLVHCAGRTRSIIGAQSLINAGIPNPVAALENGTMGWQLAGFELEYGQERFASPPSPGGLARAKECAAGVAERFGVRKISHDLLDRWIAEREERTLYLIDVRVPEEFETGHLPHAVNVQGGQLIQGVDEYIAVQNARVVLMDDTEVRAIMTASWLVQMGWQDACVLEGGIGGLNLAEGPCRPRLPEFEKARSINPTELQTLKADNGKRTVVLDLASSTYYKAHHIQGAWWGIRSRLPVDISKLPPLDTLVLTSEDGILAHLAARDLTLLKLEFEMLVLDGGTGGWAAAGLPASSGMEQAISELDDVWYMPYMFPDAPPRAKRDYLEWEIALVEQIERDGTAKYRFFPDK